MDPNESSGFFRSVFNSFFGEALGINRSTTDDAGNDDNENLANNTRLRAGSLDVVPNERCITIHYPPENVEVIAEIIEEQLNYQKTDKKQGRIYKTQDKKVTVTFYRSTSTVHVQGQRHVGWTKEFVETYDKLRPSSGPITSTPKTRQSEPIFHQVTSNMNDSNTVPKSIDESIMLESIWRTELNDTNTTPKAVDTQQTDMNDTNTVPKFVESEAVSVSETAVPHQSDVATCNVQSDQQEEEEEAIMPEKCRNCAENSRLLHALTASIAALTSELSEIRQRLAVLEPTQVIRTECENLEQQPYISHETNEKSVASNLSPSSAHEKEQSETSGKTVTKTHTSASTNTEPNTTKANVSKVNETNSNIRNKSSADKDSYAAVVKRPLKEIVQSATNAKSGESVPSTSRKNPPTKTFIIGSSILQDIGTKGLKDTQVRTMRGAGVSRVRTKIENTELCDIKNIILQVGGNDVSSQRDLEAVEEDFTKIVNYVKDRSPSTNVYISEVLPRKDADVKQINQRIKEVCEATGATLIRSTDTFKNVNARQYRPDCLHLSYDGTYDLVKRYNKCIPIIKEAGAIVKIKSCHYCGERGHSTRNCRHGAPVRCYNCGAIGHKSKLCRFRQH